MNVYTTRMWERIFSWVALVLLASILTGCAMIPVHSHHLGVTQASVLPDLSGLAWIEDDLFIGVHDAKSSAKKLTWPRVSLLRLPQSELEGVTWQSLDVQFPGPGGPSSDLESASPIPGGKGFLFAESGQEGESDQRIFFAVYGDNTLTIEAEVAWPVPIENVEAIEVGQVGAQLVFLYAERADGQPSTQLRWATLSLDPLALGEFSEVTYVGVDPVGPGARPIVALAVDSDGLIYSASAYDEGNDDGPFRSVVWRIGQLIADEAGNPQVELGEGERLATLDGLKVESIAVRESADDGKQVYVGTDDEHYGGIIRLLPGTP
ncbi:MAG: hypothetical protein KA259_01875 [Caldilineaceae bacterium]|nr:hypothetical protein [Caldilineaceae bacterium]